MFSKKVALGLVLLGWAISPAHAVTYGFTNITNDSPDVAAQLSVDVTAVGGTQVGFKFFNNVGIASNIAQVYFDDVSPALLTGDPAISDSGAGVAFHVGANPGNLPGGQDYSFDATDSVGADNPAPQNGVNSASEWLLIVFNLVTGTTFDDVLASLNSADGFRIGLHVASIAGGTSDAYLTAAVPVPPALLLLGTALAGLGVLRRMKGRSSNSGGSRLLAA